MKLPIVKVGNRLAVVLPEEVGARLGATEGGTLEAVVGPDGSLLVAGQDAHHARVIEIAHEVFREYAETFKALAK